MHILFWKQNNGSTVFLGYLKQKHEVSLRLEFSNLTKLIMLLYLFIYFTGTELLLS